MAGIEDLSAADRAQLAEAGIPLAEAERQLAMLTAFSSHPRRARLARPATLGDGIERIREDEVPELLQRAREAQEQGRFLKFVPASGAASRMFRSLAVTAERFPEGGTAAIHAAAAGGDIEAREVLELCRALPDMALGRDLETRHQIDVARLAELAGPADPSGVSPPIPRSGSGSLAPLFALFLGGDLPKGLLPFHWAGERPRTAFEEQLAEGIHYLRDAQGVSRFHFTIASEAKDRFAAELENARRHLPHDGSELAVAFSEQEGSTHALALGDDGRPARTADGRLLLRPAGHGALLRNLGATGGDIVFMKNIDNLLPERRHPGIALWKKLLAGKLLQVLAGDPAPGPWRVCGVVASSGEPGGGPFWVEDPHRGVALQIVESAEVDPDDVEQQRQFRSSSHFNPVDLVVGLRDAGGGPWDLDLFVEPARALVAEKSEGGRKLRIYERPGLWNGAMAKWNTLFVEVPAWTFAPVKTVSDLARTEHLARGR